MSLTIKVDKKVKRLNSMADYISEYVESGELRGSLESARQQVIDRIAYAKFHGHARGSLAVRKPYVLGRSATKNTGKMAFGISQPGRVCAFITIWENEERELP